MKKSVMLLAAILIVSALAGCGEKTPAAPVETAGPEQTSEQTPETKKPVRETAAPDGAISLPQGVYIAGDDLRTGQYQLTCTETDWSMHVVLFASRSAYEEYHKTDRWTVGEERRAIEQFALAEYDLEKDETGYLGLQDGTVLMLENGKGKLSSWSKLPQAAETVFNESAAAICTGVFVGGQDILEGQYTLTCTKADWSMEVVAFENVDRYRSYHRTSRFTNGEEQAAIDTYAFSSSYVGEGESCYVNMKPGSVLVIRGGLGTMEDMGGANETEPGHVGEAMPFYPGVYFVGRDLTPGQYAALCTQTEWSAAVKVFEAAEDYMGYRQTDRFTNGEENAAVEQYAFLDVYLEEGEACCMDLLDGMVLTVDNGSGELIAIDPSWGM